MTNHAGANSGCLLVGEYIDEAEIPTDAVLHPGEAVRPQLVGNYLDLWGKDDEIKEFTVLLKDGRIVTVRGHSLKHWPSAVPGESGSYGIVVRSASEEVLVALFKVFEVIGIFHGEMHPDRKIA
jgi:hypothetical protein